MEHVERFAEGSAGAKWARVIEDHRGSGLAVAGFSRERSLAISSFYGWRRRLESPRAGVGFVEVKGVADSRGDRPFGGIRPESNANNVRTAPEKPPRSSAASPAPAADTASTRRFTSRNC